MFCYDISDPKRLTKTAKVLEKYGIRVQKSFFQAEIKEEIMQKISIEILKIIDINKDYFFLYPLCTKCINNAICDGQGEIIRVKTYCIV